MEDSPLSVSTAVAFINQTLEYAYPTIVVEGEVASFKVNQNKFVFFDIKDASSTLGCFMTVYQLRIALEDGMRVRVVAMPKLTQWGKFSLTVRSVQPVGEGALKRSFDLLKAKLETEGLFATERKRPLPSLPRHIGVISSTQAAGYADFIKILSDRWGGLQVSVAHTQVQGADAAAQIVRALEHLNQLSELPDVIAIVRGGGSADDLSCFNDEPLVRAIAASRIPVLVGVGHEVDVTLADLVADQRAATPSNAAQILVPDKRETIARVEYVERRLMTRIRERGNEVRQQVERLDEGLRLQTHRAFTATSRRLEHIELVLKQLDPRLALRRGYAIARFNQTILRQSSLVKPGDEIEIELQDGIINAGVHHVSQKK